MRFRTIAPAAVALAAILAAATACQVPNQHTLVGISSYDAGRSGFQAVNFVFDQGLPGVTARYVATPPLTPSGRAAEVDGTVYVQVSFTPAVSHDARGASTAPAAYYPTRPSAPVYGTATNIAEVAQYEDYEGYVGYVIGLKAAMGNDRTIKIVKSGDTITVELYYYKP